MSDHLVEALFNQLLQRGGNAGEVFNITESARAGQDVPELSGISPELLIRLNRFAQSADIPATALLSAPYEGLKGFEQFTGIPALTGASNVLNTLGVPVAAPDATTSPASLGNVTSSLQGAGRGLSDMLRRVLQGLM